MLYQSVPMGQGHFINAVSSLWEKDEETLGSLLQVLGEHTHKSYMEKCTCVHVFGCTYAGKC